MAGFRSLSVRTTTLSAFFATISVLVLLGHTPGRVFAQFGLSVPCNACLTTQLALLPNCAGINLTNTAQQSTPQYHTCICSASFNFSWTSPCSGNSCQLSELTTFDSNFPVLLTALNITCIKPTPSPTPTATGKGNGATSAMMMLKGAGSDWVLMWAMMASILLVSIAAIGM
jgi:hypothetical protein